ncbi:MAG: DUF2461 domain-containing protein, partial [Bacteroidetes bacterium]|nr:DUF2461 domain-containing protein [Bacteroidota bacterium]
MSTYTLPKSVFEFLNELSVNNNRQWFNENKDQYVAQNEHIKAFADAFLKEMNAYDNIEKLKLYRIYRDVRFSKDKTPYKTSFSGSISRATKWLRGGYYFHLEPGNSFIAGGFWKPNAADLKRIRQEIVVDDQSLRKIIADPEFTNTFGSLIGDQVKTAPKGFSKDHPAIDLLRYKQFLVKHSFSDDEVFAHEFLNEAVKTLQNMRPFFDYMSDILTTDANGV